jgi:hypothetical protein
VSSVGITYIAVRAHSSAIHSAHRSISVLNPTCVPLQHTISGSSPVSMYGSCWYGNRLKSSLPVCGSWMPATTPRTAAASATAPPASRATAG